MPTPSAAPVIRSGLRPWNTWRKPAPSSPTRASAGTRTSSKCSTNCLSGSRMSTGSGVRTQARRVGGHDEQRQQRRPVGRRGRCAPPPCSAAASSTPGDVVLGAAQHPAVAVAGGGGREAVGVGPRVGLGDREDDLRRARSRGPGSHSLRSSGEPNSPITSAEIAAETSRSSSGAPWFAISSQTMASSTSPPPPPPYSSATLTPMNPASPSALHSSSHGVPARACST